ncbi:MAG TPA: mitofilin family membrane protein [Alphaproteobacteria bacterium]
MAEQSQNTEATIPNGEEIVERFGGIRPMAAKLEVPVTTVQGWKKRDAIPLSRRDEIVNAAAQYNINLKGLLSESVANQNARIAEDPALRPVTSATSIPPRTQTAPILSARDSDHGIDFKRIQRSARWTSVVTSTSLIVIIAVAGIVLFGGQERQQSNQIASLQNRVGTLEGQAPAPNGLPASLDATISDLQGQVQSITRAIGATGQDLAANGATLVQRLSTLEQQLASNPNLQGVVQQMQGMATNPQTAGDWQSAIQELRSVVAGLQGRMDGLDVALQQAKTENAALGSTLANATGRDLSAAAMLLALTQLREAVDRQTPFADDLALLRQVAAGTDPELAASVDKLAPYAEDGVLSSNGLKNELSGLSQDIITAKLKGEDVSLKDRIMARLQGLFSLKKDGIPVTGGEERTLIAQAQTQLDNNDVAGAMATLQQLEGPAAAAAQPWQAQAAATLAVQQIDQQLVQGLMNKIRAMAAGSATGVNAGPINLSTPQAQPQVQAQPDMHIETAPQIQMQQPQPAAPEAPVQQAPVIIQQ